MAGKRVNSKDSMFDAAHYNIDTKSLFFRHKAGGKSLLFLGVPEDVFYGMPSGANLENFISIKLQGRYSLVEMPPLPVLAYSVINQELRLFKDGQVLTYKTRKGEPTAISDNPTLAWQSYLDSYAKREPDSIEAE